MIDDSDREDPWYPKSEWRQDIADGKTTLSYTHWAWEQIDKGRKLAEETLRELRLK